MTAFGYVRKGRVKIARVPGIGYRTRVRRKIQQQPHLRTAIPENPAHMPLVFRVHAENVIIRLSVGTRQKPRPMRNKRNPLLCQFLPRPAVRRVPERIRMRRR